MTNIKIHTTEGKKVFRGPADHEALTVEGYQKLALSIKDPKNRTEVFSILYDCPYELLTDCSEKMAYVIERCTQFLFDFDVHNMPKPTHINWYDGRKIKFPNKRTIGQAIHMKELLEEHKLHEVLVSKTAAIYLQPAIDNAPFDYDRAMEIEEIILKESILKYAGLSFFLLRRLSNHGTSLAAAWHSLMLMNLKTWWQLLPKSKKSYNIQT